MRRERERESRRERDKEKVKEGGISTAGLKADLVGRGGFGWQGWQKQPDLFPGSKFVDMQESGEVVRPQGMLGLRHPQHFPSFAELPDYDSPRGPYYSEECGGMMIKTKHWCFLAEIVDVYSLVSFPVFRPRVLVKTVWGEKLIVHFHHEASDVPTTFAWEDLKKGSTNCADVFIPEADEGHVRRHSSRAPRLGLCISCIYRDAPQRVGHAPPVSSCVFRERLMC